MCILKGYTDINFLFVFVLKCLACIIRVYYFLCSKKFCVEKNIRIYQAWNFMEQKVSFWLMSVFSILFVLCQEERGSCSPLF